MTPLVSLAQIALASRRPTRDEPTDENRAVTDRPPDGTMWMRYVWLVYLIALFFQPAFDPAAGVVDWAAAFALIAVFLPLYVAGFRTDDDRQLLLIVGAMTALGGGRLADQRRGKRLRHLRGRRPRPISTRSGVRSRSSLRWSASSGSWW